MTITRPPAEVTAPARPEPLSSYARAYVQRLRAGEIGSLPGIVGIVLLVAGFGIAQPNFLTPNNFANLLTQSAVFIASAMGIIFVLLIGEIDLSAGWTSGVCAAVMATLLVNETVPWYVAILAAVVTGTVIGLVLGGLVAKLGVPSFVVTLAAFLAFQGVLLALVKQGQLILITDDTIYAIDNKNMPVWLSLVLIAVGVAGFAAVQIFRSVRRARQGVSHDPPSLLALRIGALTVVAAAFGYVLSIDRAPNRFGHITGVPIVVPIVVLLLVVLTFVLKRTRFGLYLYAVGGNTEAARRAGIPVDRIKIAAFVMCSVLASLAGVIQASRSSSVDAKFGSSLILYAVGAAVIGGTSLFGGRGRIIDAVIGGLVVATIYNGMSTLSTAESTRFEVTGAVLLAAAAVDAIARRRSTNVGLR